MSAYDPKRHRQGLAFHHPLNATLIGTECMPVRLACGLRPCYLQTSTSQECHNSKFERKMGFEIERKFLVVSDSWRNSAIRHTKIRQAYMDSNAKVSIRVRISDDSSAILTLKSRSSKLRRREFEYAIPTVDAEELISL